MNTLKEVQLVATGVYLPNKPISFDNIENIIGFLDEAPASVIRKITKFRGMMKGILKVENTYFAIDPKTKEVTDTNATMIAKAIKNALSKTGDRVEEIECMAVGIPVSDYFIPDTPTKVQEILNIKKCMEVEIHANCSSLTKSMEFAFDGLRLSRYSNAIVGYSQMFANVLNSRWYNQQKLKTEDLLLRWFLSDGAGVMFLKAVDKVTSGFRVINVYNTSIGSHLPPGMWLRLGAASPSVSCAFNDGAHHFGQAYSMVNENAPGVGLEGLKNLLKGLSINKDIDHLVITLPSKRLEREVHDLVYRELKIPREIWCSNVDKKGYNGGGSVVSTLNDMIDSKIIKKGECVACLTVESSKWMVGGFVIERV